MTSKKKISIILMVICATSFLTGCGTPPFLTDYSPISKKKDYRVKAARTDVIAFKLDKERLRMYRKHRWNNDSDFFKPDSTLARDPTLLNDSVYVKAFRFLAFQKTFKRRTVAYYAITAVETYALTCVALFLIIKALPDEPIARHP